MPRLWYAKRHTLVDKPMLCIVTYLGLRNSLSCQPSWVVRGQRSLKNPFETNLSFSFECTTLESLNRCQRPILWSDVTYFCTMSSCMTELERRHVRSGSLGVGCVPIPRDSGFPFRCVSSASSAVYRWGPFAGLVHRSIVVVQKQERTRTGDGWTNLRTNQQTKDYTSCRERKNEEFNP